jgi:hypothetical protein
MRLTARPRVTDEVARWITAAIALQCQEFGGTNGRRRGAGHLIKDSWLSQSRSSHGELDLPGRILARSRHIRRGLLRGSTLLAGSKLVQRAIGQILSKSFEMPREVNTS